MNDGVFYNHDIGSKRQWQKTAVSFQIQTGNCVRY